MPSIADLQQLIGTALMNTFGHPFLAGAILLIIIVATLYRWRVPIDAAIVIAVPLLIAFAGAFMPQWVLPFVAVALGVLAALGFMKWLGMI